MGRRSEYWQRFWPPLWKKQQDLHNTIPHYQDCWHWWSSQWDELPRNGPRTLCKNLLQLLEQNKDEFVEKWASRYVSHMG